MVQGVYERQAPITPVRNRRREQISGSPKEASKLMSPVRESEYNREDGTVRKVAKKQSEPTITSHLYSQGVHSSVVLSTTIAIMMIIIFMWIVFSEHLFACKANCVHRRGTGTPQDRQHCCYEASCFNMGGTRKSHTCR